MSLLNHGFIELESAMKMCCSYLFNGSHCVFAANFGCLLLFGAIDAYSAPVSSAASSQTVLQPSPAGPKEPRHETTAFPAVLSKLDGWHGVKLIRTYQGANSYCSYEFPKRFGLHDNGEKRLLLSLTRDRHRGIKVDIDGCMVSYDSAYNQLFRLASEYQDADAARWFVMPRGGYDGLKLDGEWAETYNLTYRPKVLINFKNLRRIVPVKEESILAEEICAVVMTSADAYLDGAGIKPVIDSLRHKGMGSLADKLAKECGAP